MTPFYIKNGYWIEIPRFFPIDRIFHDIPKMPKNVIVVASL